VGYPSRITDPAPLEEVGGPTKYTKALGALPFRIEGRHYKLTPAEPYGSSLGLRPYKMARTLGTIMNDHE